MDQEFDCIVVGAGLAGLSAARQLEKAGASTLVIESSDRPGGRLKSDFMDGFTLDHGFQVINPGYPNVKESRILNGVGFTPLVSGLIPFRIFGGLSKPGDLVTPFLRGVFLTEPKSVSPIVRREIYKAFLRGRPGLVDGGVSAFSNALATPLTNIHYGETVHRIEGDRVITDHGQYLARFIIVATNPVTATQLIPEIEVVSMSSSTTWYHATSDRVEGAGRFTAITSGPLINSVAISDVKSSYAPSGIQLFSSTSLIFASESEVRRELARIWQRDTSQWEFVAKYEIAQSLPVHPPGKALFSELEVRDRLFVVGDHRGYPSQQAAMETGKVAAKAIIERVLPARS